MTTAEQLLAVAAVALPTLLVLLLVRREALGPASAAAALVSLAVTLAWALHKAPYEGPTILSLTDSRGLTVVDLVVPPSLAIEGAVLWRVARERWPRPGRGRD